VITPTPWTASGSFGAIGVENSTKKLRAGAAATTGDENARSMPGYGVTNAELQENSKPSNITAELQLD